MPNLRRGMMAAAGAAGVSEYQLWSWGQDGAAAMHGDTNQTCSPVQVGDNFMGALDLETDGLNAIQTRISMASNSSAAIKADGTLWMSGDNSYGTLGVGDTTNRSSPTQVGSLTDWRSITICANVTVATKTDGTLWSWGYRYSNFAAGAGSGAANVSSPVQVGTDTDWSSVIQSNGNGVAASGLKTDGELWQWGTADAYWQQAGTAITNTPVQIGDKYYDYIGSGSEVSYGIEKDTGKLWAWGMGTSGVLGQGDTTSQSSPVQIGVATDWAWANGCRIKQMIFSNTAGEVWGLGHNEDGSFGQNITSIRYSSPVQIGGPGGWASGGHGHYDVGCHAITDTDGDNTGGALWWIGGQFVDGIPGTGGTAGGSSPVQVGTDTDWLCLNRQGCDGGRAKLAIKKAS